MSTFVPVADLSESLGLLPDGVRSRAPAIVWTHDHVHVIQTQLLAVDPTARTFHVRIPSGFDPRQFIERLLKQNRQECFLNLTLSAANLFFGALYLGTDSSGIKFAFPTQVFQVQRRADPRASLRDEEYVNVEFEDPLVEGRTYLRPALDLSASGISILVTLEELGQFVDGMVIQQVRFTLQGKRIASPAEVMHVSPHGTADGKVGFRFQGLPFPEAQFIANFVNEENRRQFSEVSARRP